MLALRRARDSMAFLSRSRRSRLRGGVPVLVPASWSRLASLALRPLVLDCDVSGLEGPKAEMEWVVEELLD